jgi:peroxiredoxin
MTPVNNPWRWAAIGALLACAVLAMLMCVAVAPVAPPVVWSVTDLQERAKANSALAVASQAPDFSLMTTAGGRVGLKSLRGQQVALVFIGAECPYCERLLGRMAGLDSKVAGKLLLVCAAPSGAVRQFEQTHKLTCPVLVDSAGAVQRAYKVEAVPTVCVVDAEGRVAANGHGLPEAWDLIKSLE